MANEEKKTAKQEQNSNQKNNNQQNKTQEIEKINGNRELSPSPYFSVFALSKPKSYITPKFKKSNQNLMLPKYLNKNQSNQISQN